MSQASKEPEAPNLNLFVEAVRALRKAGIAVKWSPKRSTYGRLYKVHEPDSDMPTMWMPPRVVCSLAKLSEELKDI
jgi:hypothetical protein